MRKIYTRLYLYIYVNLLTYVKRVTSKVTLCSHEFKRQVYFSLECKDVFLQFLQQQNKKKVLENVLVVLTLGSIQTKDTWKRNISLVEKNCPRDIH